MLAAPFFRTRVLAVAASVLAAGGSAVVVATPAAAGICTAQPGVSALVYNGGCFRHVVPFPCDMVTLPPGSAIPAGAVPARLLGADEPAPNFYTDPELRTVWIEEPDRSIEVFSPKPVGETPPPPPPAVEAPPAAPTGVVATAGNGRATVSWTPPAATAGAPEITSYTVTAYEGAVPLAPSTETVATTAVIAPLDNGVAYSFAVTAHTSTGVGPESERSATVTPATVPGAPRAATARAGSRSAVVSWGAPTDDGGSPVTRYTVRSYRGSALVNSVTTSAGARSAVVGGLTDGLGYTFTVTAGNALGTSPSSARTGLALPGSRPSAPHVQAVTPANGAAVVRWAAPANGGRTISGYTVRVYYGNAVVRTTSVSGRVTVTTVPRLTNGKRYSFTVSANNELGAGPASVRSAAVAPRR